MARTATPSQQAQVDWTEQNFSAPNYSQPNWNYSNGGGGGGMGINDYTLQSWMDYPNQLQNAMAQMYGVNRGNQNAQLFNNQLNAQLLATLGQAQWGAYGDIGSGYMDRLKQNDYLSNPLVAEQVRGNLGTSIQSLENQGMLDAIKAKGQIAKDLFGSFTGMFGGSMGGSGGGLRGFEATDGSGMRAALPTQSSGSPVPQAGTTGYAPVPAQPVTQQYAMQPAQAQVAPNRFAPNEGNGNPGHQMAIKYLQDYLARGGR